MAIKKFDIPYAQPNIDPQDRLCVEEVLKGRWITRGPTVQLFEEALAVHTQAKYVICFSNASTALWAACQAADVTPHDEVFVPTTTFIATATCAMTRGALLHLVDIDPNTALIDLHSLNAQLQTLRYKSKRVIIPVHFAGVSLDMQKLSSLVSHRDIIIEDAAHAIGSFHPSGEPVGSCAYSDMTVFSFHATKNITCGEGGAVSTNNEQLAQRLKRIRDSGITRSPQLAKHKQALGYYEVEEISCNYHLSDIHAALGLSQLKKLASFGQHRHELLTEYKRLLHPSLRLFFNEASSLTHYHICVIRVDFQKLNIKREKVMQELANLGIGSQVHYIPLYMHPAVIQYPNWKNRDRLNFSATDDYYTHTLTLPLFSSLRKEQIVDIVEALHQILNLN